MDSEKEPASLELSIASERGRLPRTFKVGAAGGWIGRGRDCEIQIDDPDRFISLKHARIDYAGGQFWLTDQSTNGTWLNDAATPMASGRRYPVREGDHFRIGLFDVRVAAQSSASPPAASPPSGEIASGESDPLLEFRHGPPAASLSPATLRIPLREPDPLASLLSDLTARPKAPPSPEPRPSLDDSIDRFVGTASQLAGRGPLQPPAQASATPAAVRGEADEASAVKPPAEDMLTAMAAELADLSPALRLSAEPAAPPSTEGEAGAAMALPPARPQRPIDPATAAVAAFWCGLGIIPRQLDPNDLVDVMAEFGMAFREATEGFPRLLGESSLAGSTERNPLGAGHGGLRRYVEGRHAGGMRLDEAVREVFARNERRNLAYREAVRASVERMAQSLSASAIERRFADTVRGRFARSRQAELWRLFRALEKEFGQLAEARFQAEVERRMQGEPPGPGGNAGDGFDL